MGIGMYPNLPFFPFFLNVWCTDWYVCSVSTGRFPTFSDKDTTESSSDKSQVYLIEVRVAWGKNWSLASWTREGQTVNSGLCLTYHHPLLECDSWRTSVSLYDYTSPECQTATYHRWVHIMLWNGCIPFVPLCFQCIPWNGEIQTRVEMYFHELWYITEYLWLLLCGSTTYGGF